MNSFKVKAKKGIKGYSFKHGWMVEEEPRKISLWLFKWLKIGLDAFTIPFDTMYTIPICIWSYKESSNSLSADICISSFEALTMPNLNIFPDPLWFPYSCSFVLEITRR